MHMVSPSVFVNGIGLTTETVCALERQYGLRLPAGRYWYDAQSGLAGPEGQGAVLLLPAGLALGGPLRPDASGGWTRVFLNGRQLTLGEVAFLMQRVGGPIWPGRYWLDAQGNAGPEGGPAAIN